MPAFWGGYKLEHIGTLGTGKNIPLPVFSLRMYVGFGKRLLDLLVAATALVVLSPLMLIVALLIKLEDGGSVLFRQKRIGKNSDEFTVLKFRSMPTGTADLPSAHAKDLKVTRIGKFIRRTNIDELPQLFNVLRGDMSIVGPRPPVPSQTALMKMRKTSGADRCLPGMTGLAQINGYDHMPETEKAEFDREYAENVSFLMDTKIILGTLTVLTRRPPVY